MGIQAMHNDTGFLLDQLRELDCYERFLSRELRAYNTPFFIMGVVMGFLNPPLLGKSIIKKEQREQPPIPFLLQTPYPSPTPQLDVIRSIWRDFKM